MTKVAVFSSKPYDKEFLNQFNDDKLLSLTYFECKLSQETVSLAKGFDAICIFVNDEANQSVLKTLHSYGINIIALRCAGFNNLDLKTAHQLGIKVCRVPEYSPQAVAEHAVGLLLTLSRQFHKAYHRVRENNFALNGLMGFNLHGKTVGIIGTGRIGMATLRILHGFGCKLLCTDPVENNEAITLGGTYVPLKQLLAQADIISLHCPLLPETQHMIDASALKTMKKGVALINTSRGGLVDSQAVIRALKTQHLGFLGLDVYELESDLFFEDHSTQVICDDVFQRLLTFPNVVITGHQGFFTVEALTTIAKTTIENILLLHANHPCENVIE